MNLLKQIARDTMIRQNDARHWFGRWCAWNVYKNHITGERLAHAEHQIFIYDAISWQAYLDLSSRLKRGNA